MAVTEQFREDWLEVAQETGANLESESGVPVLPLSQMDETVSIPGVVFPNIQYDQQGNVISLGRPSGYAQLPLGTLAIKTQAAQDAADAANAAAQRSETATTEAENVNATIAGMTVTITDRDGNSISVNIGFEIYRTYESVSAMNADAANVPQGKFVMIATTSATSEENARLYARNSNKATSSNPFTFLSDLDQASSAAWADWLNNMKPQITSAISSANSAASNANSKASLANSAASNANGAASTANTAASTANSRGSYAQNQGDYAKNIGDHPPYIADGTSARPGDYGYEYRWDYATQQYVKGEYMHGDDLHWDEMTEQEKNDLAARVVERLVFASVETCESIIDELT